MQIQRKFAYWPVRNVKHMWSTYTIWLCPYYQYKNMRNVYKEDLETELQKEELLNNLHQLQEKQ